MNSSHFQEPRFNSSFGQKEAELAPVISTKRGVAAREIAASLAILVAFVILAWITWAHWGNLRFDSGREMYVPQQIARGKMLYRDLWYPYGPLAPYWNALLFKLFGDRLNVLYGSGLAVTLLFSFVLFALCRYFSNRLASFIAVLSFLFQAFETNLFNYILPYSYAASMGSLFALLFIYFLVRYIRQERNLLLLASGLAAGLALLTKTEFGAACYLTFGFFALSQIISQRAAYTLLRMISYFLVGLLIPVAGYGWFVWKLSWRFLLEDAWSRRFYDFWLRFGGFRFELREILRLFGTALIAVCLWFLLAYIAKLLANSGWKVLLFRALLLAALVFALLTKWNSYIPLVEYYFLHYFFYPAGMFWLVCAFAVWLLIRWIRDRFPQEQLLKLLLCVFALAVSLRVLSKIQPNYFTSVYHTQELFVVYLLVVMWIGSRVAMPLSARSRTLLVMTLLSLEGMGLLVTNYPGRVMPPAKLETDKGRIYAPADEATTFPEVIRFLKEKKAAGKTVLILPEETSLYYFSDVESPSRWYLIHPGVLEPEEKERKYLAQLEDRGVDFVLLSNLSYKIHDAPSFGVNYNQLVDGWIKDHYTVIGQFGNYSREKPEKFGMLVYERSSLGN